MLLEDLVLAGEFVGALGILVPFALFQTGRTTPHSAGYLVANLVGSVILTVLAVVESQWGFVILQGVWALFAIRGLLPQRWRYPRAPSSGPG
jgi:fluoride ion exporter CrcB/FEX